MSCSEAYAAYAVPDPPNAALGIQSRRGGRGMVAHCGACTTVIYEPSHQRESRAKQAKPAARHLELKATAESGKMRAGR